VFDLKPPEDEVLRAEAVAATIAGLRAPMGKIFRCGSTVHGSRGSRSPRRTASRNARAFSNKPV
jgi:hypothetical protein